MTTPEKYLAKLFESDAMGDEEFHAAFPAYGEWDAGIPGLELHWSPLAWVWRMRNDPPAWMIEVSRENWDEALEFLWRLHAKYLAARRH